MPWPARGTPSSAGPQHLQFILTDEVVAIEGDTAWVTVDENLLDGPGGVEAGDMEVGGTVTSINVFTPHRRRVAAGRPPRLARRPARVGPTVERDP